MTNHLKYRQFLARFSSSMARPSETLRVHPARRAVMTITSVALAASLSSCGIRMETPQPTEPVPDANEASRQATVDDLLTIAHTATQVASETDDPKETELITSIATLANQQSSAIGGVYSSGLPDSDLGATPGPTPTDEATTSDAQELVDSLTEAATRIRSALAVPTDPDLARVYASLAISHLLSARDVARASTAQYALPADFSLEGWQNPDFLPTDSLVELIRAEDAAGYAFEVIAAMQEPDKRNLALKSAAEHRAFATQLALDSAIAGTSDDPRLPVYELPLTLSDEENRAPEKELKALAVKIESDLASSYISLIDVAEADTRVNLLDQAVSRAFLAAQWGAIPGQFPFITDGDSITSAITDRSN